MLGTDNIAALRTPGRGAGPAAAWTAAAAARHRTRTRPARPGPGATTASSRSSPSAATSTCGSTTRTSPSSPTGPASAPGALPRRGAAQEHQPHEGRAGPASMRSATSSTSPPTPPHAHPPPGSWSWPTSAATRRTSIGQLKSGIDALHAPVDDLLSNWAYMLIAALAWNIKSWHAMMMHRKHDRHAFIRMEFKRFLDTVIRIPAMIIVRARAIARASGRLHRQHRPVLQRLGNHRTHPLRTQPRSEINSLIRPTPHCGVGGRMPTPDNDTRPSHETLRSGAISAPERAATNPVTHCAWVSPRAWTSPLRR